MALKVGAYSLKLTGYRGSEGRQGRLSLHSYDFCRIFAYGEFPCQGSAAMHRFRTSLEKALDDSFW
jgi:hypothetical protein